MRYLATDPSKRSAPEIEPDGIGTSGTATFVREIKQRSRHGAKPGAERPLTERNSLRREPFTEVNSSRSETHLRSETRRGADSLPSESFLGRTRFRADPSRREPAAERTLRGPRTKRDPPVGAGLSFYDTVFITGLVTTPRPSRDRLSFGEKARTGPRCRAFSRKANGMCRSGTGKAVEPVPDSVAEPMPPRTAEPFSR